MQISASDLTYPYNMHQGQIIGCISMLALLASLTSCQSANGSFHENWPNVLENYDEWGLGDKSDVNKFLEYYPEDHFTSFQEYINGNPEKDRNTLGPVDTMVIVMYSLITVVGLLANAVVFFVIFAGSETGKTVTAIYILQLTIADTVFLFTLPVFSVQKVLHNWSFGSGICTLCQTIKFMNYYAGIFFLMAMSVDRYVAVAYSTRLTQLRTKRRTYIICFIMWIAAALMSLPLMIYARTETALDVTYCRVMFPGYVRYDPKDSYFIVFENGAYMPDNGADMMNFSTNASELGSTTEYPYTDVGFDAQGNNEVYICNHDTHSSTYKSWLMVDFVFGFIVPFVVIVISYIKILTHLKTSEQKIGHTATNRAVRMRRRVTRMVAALVVCFTICWMPHHLFTLAKINGLHLSVPICHGVENFLVALAFSNSAINPILYSFMGNNFKERLRKSVNKTQRRLRKNSRGSIPRQSSNTQSDPANARKLSGLIIYHRGAKGSISSEPDQKNQRKSSKLSQIALLGSHKPSIEFLRRSDQKFVNAHENEKDGDFVGTTTLGEQTMETKI